MKKITDQIIFTKLLIPAAVMIPAAVFSQAVAVSGKIQAPDGSPVAYASIEILTPDNKIVDAGLTDEAGNFSLNLIPGRYRTRIDAVGFSPLVDDREFTAGRNAPITLRVAEASQTKVLEEVVITSAAPRAYKVELDKKTYDVGQDITAKGGNLQDVLQNVPSVQVDADGSIAMRGSGNVRFLVNGKPSALLGFGDGQAALQAIPADQIERIEVITNPSSKFEASGTAGILNIILKKERRKGFNGSVQGAIGYLPQTMLNANLGWRRGAWSWFVNGGGGYRENERIRNEDRTYLTINPNNPLAKSLTNSDFKSSMDFYNLSAGAVVDVSDKTSINFSGVARYYEGHNYGGVTYTDIFNDSRQQIRNRDEDANSTNTAYQADLGFDHKFDDRGQLITGSVSYQVNNSESEGNYTENLAGAITERSRETRLDDNSNIVAKLDYELPIGEKSRFEAGYRLDRNQNKAENIAGFFDLNTNNLTLPAQFNYLSDYKETFNAVYAQFKSSIDKFGYQVGLRNEHSNITVDYTTTDGSTAVKKNKKYNGLFPSVYLSYALGDNSQILANYTRRIDRPRSWFLRPNASIQDIRSVFRGNPDLDPSYTDSFELGYSYQKKKLTVNPTLYYRHQTDDVKMVVFRENTGSTTTYTLPMNIGEDFRYGLDLNFNYEVTNWLRLMGNMDVFGYKTLGEYTYTLQETDGTTRPVSINYDGDGLATNARLSATVKVDKTFSMQFQGDMRGGRKTAQQNVEPVYGMNFGLSKTIWDGAGTLAFNVQDVFNSRFRRSVTNTGDIISNSEMQWRPRTAVLSLTYRFKQGEVAREQQKKRERSERPMDDDGEMF